MDKHIAIVGGGVGGLHLGLFLRQHGIEVTVHTDRRPEELARGKLLNTVAHHSATLERERELGVDHWPAEAHGYHCHYHHFGGEQPLFFRGDFRSSSRAIDYRVYLPRLMADFAERGGRIVYGELKSDDVARLADQADLVVVCTGKGPLGRMFAHDPEHSPFDRPQRLLCVGLYSGVAEEETRSVTLSVSPGHGELIDIPTLTDGGMAHALPNARFGALAGLAIVGAALAGVLGWVLARRRARRLGASPAAEAAAALAALSVLLIVLWIVRPYALVLAIPAAHAALLATSARRPWHLPALAALAVVPFVILVVSVSQVLHANVAFTVWYLMDTSANGSRGAVGLFLGLLVAACILSLTALVIERAAKGRLALPRRRGRPPRERPAAPRPPEAGAGRW